MCKQATFRIFVSAVSGELASHRHEVARVLRRKELEVRDQEHFRQGGETLVEQLRDYIRDCDAVILLIGDRCGYLAGDKHAAVLGSVPTFDEYRKATGQPHASYTQWEFFLAKHYGKKTYTFLTANGFAPDNPNDESPELHDCQKAYRAWIKTTGESRNQLTTPEKLVEDVLVLPFPDLSRPQPVSLPYPSIGTLFKGRDEFLKRLRKSLLQTPDGRATAITGKAVHGLGGVGKTRLAVEYAWRHRDDYSALLLVTADSPENLRRNLAALVEVAVLDLREKKAREEEVKVAAALRWLHEHPGWLLILDNVDTEESAAEVERLLPRLQRGHVLITGRLARWSGSIEPLELDVLSTEDAVRFLLERTQHRRRKQPTDAADARELARELDGLALALEQAGAYIAQKRITLVDYLIQWRAHKPDVQEWHDERLMKYPRSLAVTWETTMKQFGPGEIALLRLLAWFAPDPLPMFVFDGDKAHSIWGQALTLASQEFADQADPGVELRDALGTLADFSMVRWDADAETVTVHRVVQEILRTRLPEAHRNDWLSLSLRILEQACPAEPVDVRTWPRWNPLQTHVASAAAHGDEASLAEPTALLMNQLGVLLSAKALHKEAEPLMRRALTIDEQSHGPDHPDVTIDLNNLAQLLKATNRLKEAEPLMRRALAIDEQSYGPDHPKVAIHLNNLAALLKATNRLEEAEPLMRRALAIDEQSYGSDHPKVAIRLNNLAQLLQDTNRLEEAEPLMRRALAIDEQSYGPDHPRVATRLNNLALLLKATNRLEEAEPLMRRALTIDEQSYGPDHPDVAIDLNNLARLLQDTNRLEEAEPLMRRNVVIFRDFGRATGHEHPHMQTALENYHLLLGSLELSEAEIATRLREIME